MSDEKLKTLNDIEIKTSSTGAIEQTLIIATQAEYYCKLQQTAREWIKELENKPDEVKQWEKEHDELANKTDYGSEAMSASLSQLIFNWNYEPRRLYLINWIRQFFNLEG